MTTKQEGQGPLSLKRWQPIKLNKPGYFCDGQIAYVRAWQPYTKCYSARLKQGGGTVFAEVYQLETIST